ncbi:MAG: HAD hydrolase-like protein, partial [Candidatus Dormibacteraceae bacterium]
AKVDAMGLAEYIDFEVGGYGEDGRNREELVSRAKERTTAKYNYRFTDNNTVVIGDTPNDIQAAKLGGAKVISVATGKTSAADLAASNPDLVIPDLRDLSKLLNALEQLTTPEHEHDLSPFDL